MDGRNSSGRRISLLNDDYSDMPVPALRHTALPFHSRSSSFASSPSSNSVPPTPQLSRSDSDLSVESSSSHSSTSSTQRSPSPLTPTLLYEDAASVTQRFSNLMPYQLSAEQMAMTDCSVGRHPTSVVAIAEKDSRPTAATRRRSSSSSNAKCAPSKKNHYLCPLSKQYDCHDYFTTSGHAARHAKKHTGRKDAFCPECNKAFTRKDNMEQHRRTHQSGRKALKEAHLSDSGSSRKIKTHIKRSKPLPIQSARASGSSVRDIKLARRSSERSYPDVGQAVSQQFSGPYYRSSDYSYATGYGPSSMTGLDTLAIAASSETSRYPAAY